MRSANERESERNAAFDAQAEVESTLRSLIERALPIGLVLAVFAVGSSALRSVREGWQWLYYVHAFLAFAALVCFLVRRRLSFRTFTGVLLGLAAADGAVNMLSYGLAHNGLLVLGCVTLLSALAFGKRGFLTALASSLAVWTVAAVVAVTGPGEVTEALGRQLFSPWSWASQIAAGVLFVSVVAVAIYGTQEQLVRALREGRSRQRDIEKANRALSEEVEQRRRAERDLAEREQTFQLLAENLDDMLFVQDMNLDVVYVSPAVRRLFGYDEDEVKALGMAAAMTPASLQRASETFKHYVALAMQNPDQDVDVPLMEYEYVRKDGSTFWGELRVGLLRDADGNLKGSQGILRDVSERRRAADEMIRLETQLRQSEKMRAIGQLAGGIAHDFNNQLTGITMGLGLIEHNLPTDDRCRRYVEFVNTCAKRASDLTLKLLTFARSTPIAPAPTDVHDVVREVVAILEHSIDKAITVHVSLDAGRHVVHTDPAQLQSALLNIAVNARDAMPDGGRLSFRSDVMTIDRPAPTTSGLTLEAGEYMRLEVSDTGHGMDEVVCKRIFEPFFTTKPRGQGTGLGLATAFGTVTSMKGAIDVESQVGKGTSFTLYLPLHDDEDAALEDEAPASRRGTGRILLVEDEETVRLATSEMLESLGYEVRSCADGEQGLETFRRSPAAYDAVVLDVVLPKTSGKEVLAAMRALRPETRVLVVSGYAPHGEIQALLGEPNTHFVQKPYTAGELSESLVLLLHSQPGG